MAELVRSLDPTRVDEPGIGPISAAKLFACHPARSKHEAALARCNGTAPLPASSGKTVRHRRSRGGDRQANDAIHTIALIRAKQQPPTGAYLDRRISERRPNEKPCARSNASSPSSKELLVTRASEHLREPTLGLCR
ncbi:MAG: IS110 family transposase [Actinomycetota bacterium]|nr:IS110 family transposase [Actinomycetota bacterium]